MDKYQINGSDEDFELMVDVPREDPVIIEVKNFQRKFNFFFNSIIESFSVVINVIMK
jgi:hypothetical protein